MMSGSLIERCFFRLHLVLLACCLVVSTQAFVSYVSDNGQPEKWNLVSLPSSVHTNVVDRKTKAIRYFLGAPGYSDENATAELNAARACFDQWQAVPGTILRFEEGGLARGALDINTTDNTNLIYWAKTTTIVDGGRDNISGATGVTFSDYFSDGSLAEADIVLNGVEFTWFTDYFDTINGGQFVEAVLLHEIGHFLGLAHSPLGASTMFPRGKPNVSVQAGLSSDEISAIHSLYPATGTANTYGRLAGKVTLGGAAVLGAIVTAEDATGNLTAGTMTRANGQYEMTGLVPGSYSLRVTPTDPPSLRLFLFRGVDVAMAFEMANTDFAPTAATLATVKAGSAATVNFAVSGKQAFYVNRIRIPTEDASRFVIGNYAAAVPAGLSDVELGIYSNDTFDPSATLRLTGDGLTFGATAIRPNIFAGNPPLNALSVPVHIAPNATPGMRTLVVQQGTNFAYANGFIEIQPAFPDDNFDGFDDRFQRQFFPRWTGLDAVASADPDKDGYNNNAEYISGTNPVDPNSVLRVESVRLDATGATVRWLSAPGKRYQVYARPQVGPGGAWQAVGEPVVSNGSTAQFVDMGVTDLLRFYRIQALP